MRILSQEHEEYLEEIKAGQQKYLDLCEKEAMRKVKLAAGCTELEES